MALPTTFANLTTATGQQLDNNFQAVGALVTVQCTAAGTNAISLTPAANAPAVTAYNLPYPVKFGFVGFTTSTGSVTLQVGSLAALPVYTPAGAQAAGGDIVQGFYYEVAYVVASTYNSGNGAFVITNPLPLAGSSPVDLGETRGLIVTNNASTPNTKIDITASRAIMVTSAGLPVFASSVSVTIDLTTTGANGMDTGSRPTSGWVYNYLISTGLVTAGLATATSPTSGGPTMPTGYNYACYVGAMYCDSSQNLKRSRQDGDAAQYIVTSATNTAAAPNIANGTAGSYSATTPTYASVSVSAFVPATTKSIRIIATTRWNNGSIAHVLVAPNTSYSGNVSTNFPPLTLDTENTSGEAIFLVEAAAIAWVSDAAGGGISCLGWTDYYSR